MDEWWQNDSKEPFTGLDKILDKETQESPPMINPTMPIDRVEKKSRLSIEELQGRLEPGGFL